MIDAAAIELEAQRRGEHAALFHESSRWPSVRADVIRRTGLGRQETNIAARDHSLFLNIRGIAKRGENFLDGRRIGFSPRAPGDLCFLPAGHSWSGWDDGDETAAYLFIAMDRDFVRGLFEKMSGPLHIERLIPELGFQDPEIQMAARGINREMKKQDLASAMMVESLATTIVAQMLRRSVGKGIRVRGGLSPSVLGRVIDRIEASLDKPLKVTELAALAGFSVHHFCRAFRQSTGWPPHTFIIRRRLEKASELLRSSNKSITEIALACGYSSASHMSASFRKEIGASPKLYRDS
jgi:AraC-like DNA-binding protein